MSADRYTHTHTHTSINVLELVSPQGTFQYNNCNYNKDTDSEIAHICTGIAIEHNDHLPGQWSCVSCINYRHLHYGEAICTSQTAAEWQTTVVDEVTSRFRNMSHKRNPIYRTANKFAMFLGLDQDVLAPSGAIRWDVLNVGDRTDLTTRVLLVTGNAEM